MENISKLLASVGFPLHTVRQSWGAHSDLGVLLIAWADDLDESGRFVRVLAGSPEPRSTFGRRERIDHLRTLWSGGLAGYAVVATAKDITLRPRTIQTYDSESVRAIVSLAVQPDGSVWAELGDDVPVKRLGKHAAKHRLVPGDGQFPVHVPRKEFKDSSAAYVAKLPAFRVLLIDVARRGETVTYAEARAPFGLRSFELRHAMDRLGHACLDAGEPILTSLIVDEHTRRCSSGFSKEFRRDDANERADCYAFWSPLDALPVHSQVEGPKVAEIVPGTSTTPGDALRERAARFAKVELRPEQAAFRRRVFLTHRGACLVTGCTIPEALDAAHREGRDWRCGHNSGADGLLLRKDIHALYDAKLVSIDDSGAIRFHPDVEAHYRQFLREP